MPQAHTFELILTIDMKVITVPDPASVRIRVGDTVRYHSRHGKLHILWTENVFDKPTSTDADVLNVISAGTFVGRCEFDFLNGTVLSWSDQGAGGKSEDGEQGPGTGGKSEEGEEGGGGGTPD